MDAGLQVGIEALTCTADLHRSVRLCSRGGVDEERLATS